MNDNSITYFAETTSRTPKRFGIRKRDRRYHTYIIGRTGTGKSSLIRTFAADDLKAGEGFALFDPHGDLAREVKVLVPPERAGDLIFWDVADPEAGIFFNPVEALSRGGDALAAAGLVEIFKKLWDDSWGPRLEHLLRNVAFTLLAMEGTLADIPRLLHDEDFRREAVERVRNPAVRAFWEDEYEKLTPGLRGVMVSPLENKVGAFLTDPLLAKILSSRHSSFDLRRVIDEGNILILSLSKGRMGEGPASLLGSLLLSSLSLAGLSRSDTPEEKRRDFAVYLDEFQTFSTLSLPTMLSELRKYRVSLTLAHQYLGQLDPAIRDAVWGNVGTFIAFRVGALDAPTVAREFAPVFGVEDLTALPNHEIYLKLMIDGAVSRGFSAVTNPSPTH